MKINNNNLKKVLVYGLALVTLVSAGAGLNKAGNPTNNATTAKASSCSYHHIINYLHWVQRYDHTHKNNIHTWKLTHLYDYMDSLSSWQYMNVKNLFNTYHSWYYSNNSTLNKVNDYFNKRNKVINSSSYSVTHTKQSSLSNKQYKHLLNLFKIDLKHGNKTNNWNLNHYLALNWNRISNKQILDLSNHQYKVFTFLDTNYNKCNFKSLYRRANNYQKARFTATNKIPELSQQDDQFDTDVRADLVNDINQTRKEYGLNALTVTNAMQATANYRNPKVMYGYEHYNDYMNYPHHTSNPSDNWIHGNDTHNSGSNYLNNNHYAWHNWAANAGNIFRSNNNVNGDGTPDRYENTTASGIAENINDGLINHDNCEGNNNGHRNNELNPSWKYLGVGVTYDNNAHMGSYNEQFAN